jgi:hypothetical protein
MSNPAKYYHSDLIKQESALLQAWRVKTKDARRTVKYTFSTHHHPFTDDFIEQMNREGLEGLLDVAFQELLGPQSLEMLYAPNEESVATFPIEELDLSDSGPYAIYNWELFFHAPFAVAVHLSKNQRFAEAQRWFHFIFDPTSNDPVTDPENPQQRFWKFLRFREENQADFIDELLTKFAEGKYPELSRKIQGWRDKPFQPHVVARGRFFAFQMNVVMKYLDNLIAWGDSLFRQDTMETLNEAAQLYVLAANILGPKPQRIPPRGKTEYKSYAQLKGKLDDFGNALVAMENDFPFNIMPTTGKPADEGAGNALFGIGRTLYFCIQQNDKLLGYWDTVADRLFKIRHCMNIEGTVRALPLFEPPIDPGLLVKAAAAGLNIGNVVSSLGQPVSTVRSGLLLQKALEICAELKSMGAALLSAIEKQEAEHLSALRQQHEVKMLELARDVKFLQWKETEASTEALLSSRTTVFERYSHYQRILGKKEEDLASLQKLDISRNTLTEQNFESVYDNLVTRYVEEMPREAYRQETTMGGLMEFAGDVVVSLAGGELGKTLPLNKNENAELNVYLPSYDFLSAASTGLTLASSLLKLIPQYDIYLTPWGIGLVQDFGGRQLSGFAKTSAEFTQKAANAFASSAERASKLAYYYRRAEDYVLQSNLAASELTQLGRQIVSALIREQIARKDYDNHLKQLEQSIATQEFMREKFTQEELYTWMRGEISKVYFDCYQFAFDLARRTEQVMKYELMRPEFEEQSFIKFGYWDGSRQGLLSGEMLYLDLKRLEMAYHEHNRREYELTKNISLKRLDPMALLRLKATGSCELDIPEWFFDLDSPGQYLRRIKSVAVSIPCIVGPHTGVHCKLSLMSSSVRISSVQNGDYARENEEDQRFRDFRGTIQSIVTSTAQNDAGLFELNLRDERYLPFEGAGVISKWRIELPLGIATFNADTISDVILHFRYTAREAGGLKQSATDSVRSILQSEEGKTLMFSLQQDFPNAWHKFIADSNPETKKLNIQITPDHLPYWTRKNTVNDDLPVLLCAIDAEKKRLSFSPIQSQPIVVDKNVETGNWELSIDGTSPFFKFINDHERQPIFLMVRLTLV